MVIQIELSDDRGEHIEIRSDRTARLFGRNEWDDKNGCFNISERQLDMLRILLDAQTRLLETLR